jgi:hypothetical protein
MDRVLALGDTVFDPVKPHVHGFGPALFYCVIDNAQGTGVVGLQWGGVLWMANFGECNLKGGGNFGVIKQCAGFSLCCRGKDWFHDGAVDVDCSIHGRWHGCWLWWQQAASTGARFHD